MLLAYLGHCSLQKATFFQIFHQRRVADPRRLPIAPSNVSSSKLSTPGGKGVHCTDLSNCPHRFPKSSHLETNLFQFISRFEWKRQTCKLLMPWICPTKANGSNNSVLPRQTGGTYPIPSSKNRMSFVFVWNFPRSFRISMKFCRLLQLFLHGRCSQQHQGQAAGNGVLEGRLWKDEVLRQPNLQSYQWLPGWTRYQQNTKSANMHFVCPHLAHLWSVERLRLGSFLRASPSQARCKWRVLQTLDQNDTKLRILEEGSLQNREISELERVPLVFVCPQHIPRNLLG